MANQYLNIITQFMAGLGSHEYDLSALVSENT